MRPANWRFNPVNLLDLAADALPGVKRKRLPNPSLTLFEVNIFFSDIVDP